jgi:hypothetical protein
MSLVSLLLNFGIFGITGKFEFNSDSRISGDIHRQATTTPSAKKPLRK